MKRLFLLLINLCLIAPLFAQSDITIGLVMPESELDGVKPDAYKILKTKIEKILTSSGVGSYGGEIVMYPVVTVVEEQLVEGGIKNFYKVKIDLTLNVVNPSTKTLFLSDTWSLAGSAARVKSEAVKNAFSKLNQNDPKFKEFLDKAKIQIINYYDSHKDAILANASKLASTGQYEEAMAILAGFPHNASGYAESQNLSKQIYIKYIDHNAAKILNEARGALAQKNYEKAVNLASQINPESSHYKESVAIMNQVRSAIKSDEDAENKRIEADKKRAMQALEIAADVEKNRTNAIASVAKAYYGRKVVNYNNVRIW